MKQKIITSVKVANSFIDIIEQCERDIKAGINPDYFRAVKTEAEENLAEAIKNIATLFTQCSKTKVCTPQS